MLFFYFPSQGQNNVGSLENLVEKLVDEIDPIVSKYNFKIRESGFVQSTGDTSLYGMRAKWVNNKNEVIILDRMEDYVPAINSKNVEVGKVQVLKKTITLMIRGQKQAENILGSLRIFKYSKVSSTPISNGFEVKYDNKDYELTYRKEAIGDDHIMVYSFIVAGKAYQIVKKIFYNKE